VRAKAKGKEMSVHSVGKFRRSKRYAIFKRDGFMCLCCGHNVIEDLTLDHIIPRCMGGKNNVRNLQTLCVICNGVKGLSVQNYREKPVYGLKPQKRFERVEK
jgi:5-methylcytosine-specific restriction endonuclease McrA